MNQKTKALIKVFAALAVLTISTALISLIKLGWMNFVIAMLIAFIKASLVSLFFMQVHRSKILVKVFAIGGLFWLFTLLGLSLNDYISRSWITSSSIWMH